MEHRYTSTELRADAATGTIAGYAVVYNATSEDLGGFREQIAPGAFDAALDGDVRALWQHDHAAVLGRTAAGTLHLTSDDTGMRFVLNVADTATGRDALELVRRGDVNQMSFGFGEVMDRWEKRDDGEIIRIVERGHLAEISIVTWPAYPQATAEARAIYGQLPVIPADLDNDAGSITETQGDRLRAQAAARMRTLAMMGATNHE